MNLLKNKMDMKLNLMKYPVFKNPFFIFLPFLLLFIILVLVNHNDFMDGDEGGYISFTKNMLQGFYSPPPPSINLWWGPGYPLFLLPFIAFNLPYIFITLTNAFLQYFSIVLLFKALQRIVEFRIALLYSLIWAFCFSSFEYIYQILTESLTSFLVALFLYFLVNSFSRSTSRYIYFAGITLGFLALTKVIFGFIIFILLTGSILIWLLNRNNAGYKKIALVMMVAFLTISPYLLYTYNLTNKWLNMGNLGGSSLYWMSNPNEYEYGDWNNETLTANTIDPDISIAVRLLEQSHKADLNAVNQYKGVEKDDAYKKIALENIKSHPVKYVKNVFSNTSRMFFGFPYTYTFQRPIIKVWYFAVIYFLIVVCSIFTLVNWLKVPKAVKFVFLFTFLYLAISSMVSIGNRQFVIIMPVLLFWMAYIINQSLSFKFKWE